MLAELLTAVETVDLRHIGEAGLSIKNEVAEKALIERHRRRLAEHFAQRRQVVLSTNNAQDIAFPQAGAAGGVQQDIVAKQRGNPRLRWHVQVAQRRADAPLIGPQLVDKLLPRVFRVNIQPDAGDGPADGRHHHFGFFRRPRQRSALQQQRHQHHEEGDIEEQAGVVQAGHHREHRENNGHRAAQANPADKHPFAQVKAAKRQQAGKHRQGPGNEYHPHRQQQRRDSDRQQVGGRHQQAQHQEHGDLRQPRQTVEVLQDTVPVADRPVAQQKAAEIDGEDTAAVEGSGDGENHDPAAQRQQRIEPGGQHDAVDHLQQQVAAAEADGDPETELLNDMHGEHPAEAGLVLLDHFDQGDGQEDRHRVVTA